jgi:hypothetical protein
MPRPTAEQIEDRFAVGLVLDHLWSETMGLPKDDKEQVLASLVRVLDASATPYAVIGGVAVQLYTSEPRTTADLDVALRSHDDLPREDLVRAGFVPDGVHEWTENWRGPAPRGTDRKLRVAIQFSADDLMARAVSRAETVSVGKFSLRLATLQDLISLKLAAAAEPKRRVSKRSQDVTDVLRLLEEHPELDDPEVRIRVAQIRSSY